MSGECPNPDCKERVTGHHHTLYGENGRGGVVQGEHETKSCLIKLDKEKVSRRGMITTIVLIVLSLLGTTAIVTVYGLDSLKEDRAVVAENKQEIATIDAKLGYLEVMVEENHNNLEAIKDKVDELYLTPKELKKLIKEAVKAGSQ